MSVRGLEALGQIGSAGTLARLCVSDYAAVWGSEDVDTRYLKRVAAQEDPLDTSFGEFSWKTASDELRSACSTDCWGGPDNGRIVRALGQLRAALQDRSDPRSTSHLGR